MCQGWVGEDDAFSGRGDWCGGWCGEIVDVIDSDNKLHGRGEGLLPWHGEC